MNDLDGGENVGDQLDLPAGGCEDGAVAITEGDRTPRAAAPSFRADRRICMRENPENPVGRGAYINQLCAAEQRCEPVRDSATAVCCVAA